MATPSSMILRSLRLLGEKIVGGSLTAAEQTAYLADLNTMLESWSLERLLCYQLLQESKALTASTGSYTIGSGGTWDTARPVRIVDPCFTRDSSGVDHQLSLIDAEAYGRIALKTVDGGYPYYLFYDTAYASGLATIFLWPEPVSGLTLYINSWKPLQSFSTISDTVLLPPGYQRAIEFSFAIEIAGGYTNVSPEVAAIARQAKAAIKGVNAPDNVMQLDPGVLSRRFGRYDIRTG